MPDTALKQPTYFTPKKHFKGINAAVLKIIAIVIMTIDHTSIAVNGGTNDIWRTIGRLAFPIFAYFIAQGAVRTKHIGKYMLRLGIFALISEIPFNMISAGSWTDTSHQNVYFTLLLGLVGIFAVQKCSQLRKGFLAVFPIASLLVVSELIHTDYGAAGVLTILFFYLSLDTKGFKRVILTALICLLSVFVWYRNDLYFNTFEAWAVFATPLILLYNGEKGFYIPKYVFYGFYPVHLLILGLLRIFVFN